MMKFCDASFLSPAENLACDEALLDACEQDEGREVLRVWESPVHFVVVGYANRVASEVNRDFCEQNCIPVLRRCSGGGTVLQGPGCLNYSLILRIDELGPLRSIHSTNCHILTENTVALQTLLDAKVEMQGDTDLAIGGLKISGNAQRRKQRALLFHGSFLLKFDISLIQKALPMPSRQPAYRKKRSHSDFIRNLEIHPDALTRALRQRWQATDSLLELPSQRIANLARDKYGTAEWNFKF